MTEEENSEEEDTCHRCGRVKEYDGVERNSKSCPNMVCQVLDDMFIDDLIDACWDCED